MKNYSKQEFIEKAKLVHGDKYDYNKVEYVDSQSKVCIVCPQHGEFWCTPNNHLRNRGCPKCKGDKTKERCMKTTEMFIEEAKKVHGNKYDYTKVVYNGANNKVCIICPIHGEFLQTPHAHLRGQGCKVCANETKKRNAIVPYSTVVEKFKKVHGDKYIYLTEAESRYIDATHKINIMCPTHGIFQCTPNSHLNGSGCSKCSKKHQYTTEEFIEEAEKVHGDKYDYSKVEYVNAHTKICIICSEHGEFWQTPSSHLCGNGCNKCNASKLEKEINLMLTSNDISFETQKKFEWLGKQSLDFYIPSKNIAIECQGVQHFKVNNHFGGKKGYLDTLERDERKRQLCEENGIKLLYYSDLNIEYPYKVYETKETLLTEIIKA